MKIRIHDIYIYVREYIHRYIHTYIFTCMHACMHAYIHMYTQLANETQKLVWAPGLSGIGAGVHADDALLGQEVVHDGEDALFHLACVLRAQDHHLRASFSYTDDIKYRCMHTCLCEYTCVHICVYMYTHLFILIYIYIDSSYLSHMCVHIHMGLNNYQCVILRYA